MSKNNRDSTESRKLLATDLDGTLIPLGDDPNNARDLNELRTSVQETLFTLAFVTGRHFESVIDAIEQFDLPVPDWIICDVGTSIYQRVSSAKFDGGHASRYESSSDYAANLQQRIGDVSTTILRERLTSVSGLRSQEDEKQGTYKFSYYADSSELEDITRSIQTVLTESCAPWSIISSVDPFNGDGLIDLLPAGCSKAFALDWLVQQLKIDKCSVVFAGDSGNDLAALTVGYQSIVVANADRKLARQVYQSHAQHGWKNRLYLSSKNATSGVLQGCRWFGLLPLKPDSQMAGERFGCYPTSNDSAHFQVWAPAQKRVEVVVECSGSHQDFRGLESRSETNVALADENETLHEFRYQRFPLQPQANGYFRNYADGVGPDAKYKFVLDDGDAYPDPTSHFQPDSVNGFSQLVDHDSFPWTDQNWCGRSPRDLVIYELHVGTFTREGTFIAAIDRIEELVDLGITAIELMPVVQTPGRWNWGYDGVGLFAVRNSYGTPDEFKALVDACHAAGIAVFLDVVYNHIGPEGNYLSQFAMYFSKKHSTPWGAAFAFDGPDAQEVRRFIVENALYWLNHYHLDGLRLDAVHFMFDDTKPGIVSEIQTATSRFAQSSGREVHLFLETNVFDAELLSHARGKSVSIWCDCLMHSIYSQAGAEFQFAGREYRGIEDIFLALQRGYVYSGADHRRVQDNTARKSDSRHLPSLVVALQNHDAVGIHPVGDRLHHITSSEYQKAAATLILLHPGIPLIFMGEDWAAESKFPFFVDFKNKRLAKTIDKGRKRAMRDRLQFGYARPSDPKTFESAICPPVEQNDVRRWYRKLIRIRKQAIAQGWFRPELFHASCDFSQQIIHLQYKCNDSNSHPSRLQAFVRLTPSSSLKEPAVIVNLDNSYVMTSSKPFEKTNRQEIVIQPNHAVVACRM